MLNKNTQRFTLTKYNYIPRVLGEEALLTTPEKAIRVPSLETTRLAKRRFILLNRFLGDLIEPTHEISTDCDAQWLKALTPNQPQEGALKNNRSCLEKHFKINILINVLLANKY